MNEKNNIEETIGEFKWEFKKLKNFLYKIGGVIYCIGGGVCEQRDDNKKEYFEYKELIKDVDFKKIKSYKEIENYEKLFNIFNNIVENNKLITGSTETDNICNKLCENEELFSELKEQKEKFLSMCKYHINYEINLYF